MQELGLPENPDVPLLGFIGRLDYQKGVDIIRDSYDWLMAEGCQLVLLGSGAPDLENSLRYVLRCVQRHLDRMPTPTAEGFWQLSGVQW